MPMPELPVYLFTGFLEAGKTKFIQETLTDKRFNNGQRTLILLCEEGEEEYDLSAPMMKNVFIETLDEEEQLTEDVLNQLAIKHRAARVLVEYNGMWRLQNLFQNMPQNWVVYQEFLFVDAATFLAYNANMRSLVVDKLNSCELVVFNRFTTKMDKMEFHKIVRGVSRRADIAYEYENGSVEYDDIEDPLPFDIEAPVITIEDDDYALWYRDISEEPKKYDGKTVEFKGFPVLNKKVPAGNFVFGRKLMTCCVDDIQYTGLLTVCDPKAMPENLQWYTLRAKVVYKWHKLYGRKGPVLQMETMTAAQPPQQEVATFY